MRDEEADDNASPTEAGPTALGATIDETEAHTAWSLENDAEEWPDRRPTWIVALAVGTSALVVVIAGTIAAWHLWPRPPGAAAPPTVATPPPPSAPTAPLPTTTAAAALPVLEGVDGAFIEDMRRFGVPVSDQDPRFTVELAQAVCATAREGQPHDYPPGTHTFTELSDGVMDINPDWTLQQATRLTRGALNYYCPEIWGPGQDEIAAMPPDQRYLAVLQDRLGITPSDDSLNQAAQQICGLKGQGWTYDRIVGVMNGSNPPEDERVIAETAVEVYCPQHGP